MRAIHARIPKNFVLEEHLETYASVIETNPSHWKGHWKQALAAHLGSGDAEVTVESSATPATLPQLELDLGCGKGAFLIESAKRSPNHVFIGIDSEPLCVARAAQYISEAQLRNVVIVPGTALKLQEYFAEGELNKIFINFPTPFPRKKDAHKRVVLLDRLLEYRGLLAPGATIEFRSDSQPLYAFARTQFELAGYELLWKTEDLRRTHPETPSSEYEEKLSKQGARVLAFSATPGAPVAKAVAKTVVQTAELSLAPYVAEHLDDMDYIPHGMQALAYNLKRQRERATKRSGRDTRSR